MVATPDRAQLGNMVQDGAQAVWNGPDYQTFRDQLSSETATGGLSLVLDLLGDVLKSLQADTAQPLQFAFACCTLMRPLRDQVACKGQYREDRGSGWAADGDRPGRVGWA